MSEMTRPGRSCRLTPRHCPSPAPLRRAPASAAGVASGEPPADVRPGVTAPAPCRRPAKALAEPGPALVEAVVDSNEPPLPPHITADQATNFAQSLMRGQPEAIDIMRKAMTTKIRELV